MNASKEIDGVQYTASAGGITVTAGEVTQITLVLTPKTTETGSVEVTVTLNELGEPDARVIRTPDSREGTTDASGKYTFTDVEPGSGYSVLASKTIDGAEYTGSVSGIAVVAGETTSVTVELALAETETGSLEVLCRTSAGSEGGVTVTLSPGGIVKTTGANGIVLFAGLAPRIDYSIVCEKVIGETLYYAELSGIAVEAGQTTKVEVTLVPTTAGTGALRVTVLRDGVPEVDALVALTQIARQGTTNADGVYTFYGLLPSFYDVLASKTIDGVDYTGQSLDNEVLANETTETTIMLEPE